MADPALNAKADAGTEEEEAAGGKEEVDLKKRRGVLSFFVGVLRGIWRVAFGGRAEDLGKRLEFLTKEEEAVHGRVKRRAQWWRATARNIIVFSILLEIAAVVYAVIVTRSLELSWQMRAVRVLPMFATPGLSYIIYSTIASFIRMRDRKDQKTLERLRAERQAKINELKEKTNYYSTQQLIQRYDLDPAAKAAAATVLASKLGADSGLKVSLGDEAKLDPSSGKSNDVKLVSTDGLRNRKQSEARNHTAGSSPVQQSESETSQVTDLYGPEASNQDRRVVEHYRGPGSNDGGWIARIAALLVGEDPTQSYALICGNCHMHNGLSRKEDFPYITYYCPHCHALNGPPQPEGHNFSSGSVSGNSSPPASSDGNTNRIASGASSVVPGAEVGAVQGETVEVSKENESDVQR